MGLFDDLLSPTHKTILDPGQFQQPAGFGTAAAMPTGATPTNPFSALIAKLFVPTSTTGTKPTTDFGALINALRTVPHLGIGGGEMTPGNPTGDPRNPWGAGGLLDNPTHAAAQAINAQPLWRKVNGMLVHGTNYPAV